MNRSKNCVLNWSVDMVMYFSPPSTLLNLERAG